MRKPGGFVTVALCVIVAFALFLHSVRDIPALGSTSIGSPPSTRDIGGTGQAGRIGFTAGRVETFPGNLAAFAREGLVHDADGAQLILSNTAVGNRSYRSGSFA